MRHVLAVLHNELKASIMQKCRVLLVDDHVPVRIALRRMLTGYANVHVVGEACDGKQAIELVPLYQPHVVLMDFYMPRMNGVEAARIMKESWQEIAIIGISMAPDTFITDAFVKAGAVAVVSKDQVDHLYSTIQQASPKILWEA
jgi:DNA-binding NarL/FixJ family response regulator